MRIAKAVRTAITTTSKTRPPHPFTTLRAFTMVWCCGAIMAPVIVPCVGHRYDVAERHLAHHPDELLGELFEDDDKD